MSNEKQFNLEVYSRFGIHQFQVDIFAGKIIEKQNGKDIKIVSAEKNIIYIEYPGIPYRTAIIHNYEYGCMSFINRQSMHYFKDVFVFPIEKYKTIYFEISKNACTAIASELYNHFRKKFFQPKITSKNNWDDIWRNPNNFNNLWITKNNYLELKSFYSDWKKFIVYDEPIKRFLRVINDKLNGHTQIASIIPLPEDNDYKTFIDKMILAAQMQTLNTNFFDQHLVPISLYVKDFLNDITDFVYLNDLNVFMKEKFNINQQRLHASSKTKKITIDMLSDEQLGKLKEIYKDDYNLVEKYRAKLYRPKANY